MDKSGRNAYVECVVRMLKRITPKLQAVTQIAFLIALTPLLPLALIVRQSIVLHDYWRRRRKKQQARRSIDERLPRAETPLPGETMSAAAAE